LNGFENQSHVQSFDDKLSAIDKLIMDAAAATDAGDFAGALVLFREALQALKSARQLINDADDLTETENSIAEINQLLGEYE